MTGKTLSEKYSCVQFRPDKLQRFIRLWENKPKFGLSLHFEMLRFMRFIIAQAENDLKIIARYGKKENRERNLIATADVLRMAHNMEKKLSGPSFIIKPKKRIA